MPDLEELESPALFQLLKHGAQMPEAAPGLLHVCCKAAAMEQLLGCICKVLLERKQLLQRSTKATK